MSFDFTSFGSSSSARLYSHSFSLDIPSIDAFDSFEKLKQDIASAATFSHNKGLLNVNTIFRIMNHCLVPKTDPKTGQETLDTYHCFQCWFVCSHAVLEPNSTSSKYLEYAKLLTSIRDDLNREESQSTSS